MGQTRRRKPKYLASKLLTIRHRLGVTQAEMAKLLRLKVAHTIVSGFERGTKEPDLIVLLQYAKLAGVSTDLLIDDKLSLP
jgi:transcriptional regulator with XRE-family HTH domain